MASSSTNLTELAARVSENTAFLTSYLNANGLTQPSFGPDALPDFPNPTEDKHVQVAREAVLDDAKALYELILGPVECLKWAAWSFMDMSVLQVIYGFKLAQAVPLQEGATYAQIAKETGVSEHRVTSIIRQAMTNRIFTEDSPNHVVHTAMSAILVKDPVMWDWVGHFVEELYPSAAKWTEAMQRYPNSQEPSESPFSVAFGSECGFFGYVSKNEAAQARFFGVMKAAGNSYGLQHDHIANGYAWAELGDTEVVDVGGSAGHVSITLAKRFPGLKFVVQDLAHTVEQADKVLPAELRGRVSYMPHDFFTPQPIRAKVYLLRHICHDWSDKYAIMILQQIISVMDADSKIILVENIIVPPRTCPLLEEKYARNMDLNMFSKYNAQERSAEEWAQLVIAADPRLKISSIQKPPGSSDSIIEVSLSST